MNPRSYTSIREEAKKCKTRGELMKKVIAAFRGTNMTPAEVVVKTEKETKKPSTSTPTTSEVSKKI